MARRSLCFIAFSLFLTLVGTTEIKAEWPANGTPVCTDSLVQRYPQITTDGAGGAIITWIDYRSGYTNAGVYAQRIAANGDPLWAIDGIPICTAPNTRLTPRLISDGSGGAIIIWNDVRSGIRLELYAQRINASGIIQWTPDVAVGLGCESWPPNLISDGAGGAIITCTTPSRGSTGNDIWAYRIDGDGHTEHTVVCAAIYDQISPQLISDGEGGVVIAWEDYRNGISGGSDVYAQRVDSNGTALWATDGIPISTAVEGQRFPELASDGAGGAIITWQDNGFIPVTADYDIFAQRISADGYTLWAQNGVPVCTFGNDQEYPKIIPDGAGGAIIVWTRRSVEQVSAQRIDPNGNALWTTDGILISLIGAYQPNHRIIPDGRGGAIITWGGASFDIYAQHVKANGDILCPPDGLPICTAANLQQDPQITSDGAGGAIVTWYDGRNGNDDIYAAKVPKCGCIATLLQGFNVSPHALDITLEWTLSEAEPGVDFHMLRAEATAGFFKGMDAPAIEQDALCYTFRDKAIEPGISYRYRVEFSDASGRRVLFETDQITVPAPSLALHQNHPNPFNPVTTISYSLPSASHVTLEIYDVSGRRIARLANEVQKGGTHTIEWGGLDEKGNPVCSGIYIYRLEAGKEVISRKMVLLR